MAQLLESISLMIKCVKAEVLNVEESHFAQRSEVFIVALGYSEVGSQHLPRNLF